MREIQQKRRTPERLTIPRICEQCQASFFTRQAYISRGGGRFCSHRCAMTDRRKTVDEQLNTFIDRSGGPDACWPWTGRRDPDGYGSFSAEFQKYRAHRIIWERANNRTIPDDMLIRHLCPGGGNPWCCNPRHLEPGTVKQNSEDMIEADRHPRGERGGLSKLTDEQVIIIRTRLRNGESCSLLAQEFSVVPQNIVLIRDRRTWRHLP